MEAADPRNSVPPGRVAAVRRLRRRARRVAVAGRGRSADRRSPTSCPGCRPRSGRWPRSPWSATPVRSSRRGAGRPRRSSRRPASPSPSCSAGGSARRWSVQAVGGGRAPAGGLRHAAWRTAFNAAQYACALAAAYVVVRLGAGRRCSADGRLHAGPTWRRRRWRHGGLVRGQLRPGQLPRCGCASATGGGPPYARASASSCSPPARCCCSPRCWSPPPGSARR